MNWPAHDDISSEEAFACSAGLCAGWFACCVAAQYADKPARRQRYKHSPATEQF